MGDVLSNCPFCGSEADIVCDLSARRCSAKCRSCKANITISYGNRQRRVPFTDVNCTSEIKAFETAKDKAISLWNKRPYTTVEEIKGIHGSKYVVSEDINQTREQAIINSIQKQGEPTSENTHKLLLHTLRGASVTLGMILDVLNSFKGGNSDG